MVDFVPFTPPPQLNTQIPLSTPNVNIGPAISGLADQFFQGQQNAVKSQAGQLALQQQAFEIQRSRALAQALQDPSNLNPDGSPNLARIAGLYVQYGQAKPGSDLLTSLNNDPAYKLAVQQKGLAAAGVPATSPMGQQALTGVPSPQLAGQSEAQKLIQAADARAAAAAKAGITGPAAGLTTIGQEVTPEKAATPGLPPAQGGATSPRSLTDDQRKAMEDENKNIATMQKAYSTVVQMEKLNGSYQPDGKGGQSFVSGRIGDSIVGDKLLRVANSPVSAIATEFGVDTKTAQNTQQYYKLQSFLAAQEMKDQLGRGSRYGLQTLMNSIPGLDVKPEIAATSIERIKDAAAAEIVQGRLHRQAIADGSAYSPQGFKSVVDFQRVPRDFKGADGKLSPYAGKLIGRMSDGSMSEIAP